MICVVVLCPPEFPANSLTLRVRHASDTRQIRVEFRKKLLELSRSDVSLTCKFCVSFRKSIYTVHGVPTTYLQHWSGQLAQVPNRGT